MKNLLSVFGVLLLIAFSSSLYASVAAKDWSSGYTPAGDFDAVPPQPPSEWFDTYGGQLIWNKVCDGQGQCPPVADSQFQRRVRACPTGMGVVGFKDNGHHLCDVGGYCEPPSVLDEETGECVVPQEICYTNLESRADECVFINPVDPDPELNCVTDSTGLELCLNDNPLCYTIEGQTACPDPDAVCGWKNGTYSCVKPEEEGCGYFNGELVCFDKNNEQIDENSPDHPKNGGNMDGDDTNDATDPRDPTEGGDPDNQPGKPASDFEGVASEKTLRGIKETLEKIAKDGIPGTGGSGSDGGDTGDDGNPGDGLSFNGTAITFDLDDGLSQLQAARDEYDTLITGIRAQFSSSFGSFSGSGTLADNNISIKGVDINNGLSKWAPYLSILGAVILFAAAFISLGIVMGAKD